MARIESWAAALRVLFGGGGVRLGLPLAGQGADKLAILEPDLGVALPGRTAAELGGAQILLAELGEERPPAGIDGVRIVEILAVERLNEGGIAAEQE